MKAQGGQDLSFPQSPDVQFLESFASELGVFASSLFKSPP